MACREMNEDVTYSCNTESGCKCYYCAITVYSVLIVFSLKNSVLIFPSTIYALPFYALAWILTWGLLSVIRVYSILII